MIAILIAWALIGAVHAAAAVLEVLEEDVAPWTWRDSLEVLCYLAVMLPLWPVELEVRRG